MIIYQEDGFKIEHMIELYRVQKKEKKEKNESFFILYFKGFLIGFV